MNALFKNRISNKYFQFIKQGPNLTYYSKVTSKFTRERPPSQEFELATKIIKVAIHKFASDELKNKIFYGYRRSDGSDAAAEDNFLKADLPPKTVHKDEHYVRALKVTSKLFEPSRKLRPVAFPDLRYYNWTLPTSAEAPYTFKAKWLEHLKEKQSLEIIPNSSINFHNLYDEIFNKNRDLIHKIKYHDSKFWKSDGTPIPYYWHSLHTRAHLVKSEDPDKNRAVFGTPKLLLQAENMFIWPLSKEYLNRNVDSPLLWGYETFKGGWNRLWNKIYNESKPNTFLGIDWSGFDRRAKFEVIDDVHDIWESYFEFDKGYEPTNQNPNPITDEYKIRNLWTWIKHSVKYTPIRAESGNLYQFNHSGIASGFQETQLLDTFVNCIMLLTCLSSLGINIESKDFIIFLQGDDSLVSFPEYSYLTYNKGFLEMIAKEASDRFDATLNVEKSSISDHLNDLEVLSYKNRYGNSYRDEAELLAQLLYPERNYRTLGATASAAVGIAMASMGNSEVIHNICFDIWNHIVNEIGEAPKFINAKRWIGEVLNLRISGKTFPSLLELKDQQFFWNKERTESEKNKFWPVSSIDKKETEFGFLRP